MNRISHVLLLVWLLMTLAACATKSSTLDEAQPTVAKSAEPIVQPEPFEPSAFMRFVDLGNSTGFLHTAVVSYENAEGVQVHLIGAVHIADAPYYTRLRAMFTDYDALLYEMVKPKDAEPPKAGRGTGSGTSAVQRMMTRVLELQFQLDGIDYRAENFIHADLTREEFAVLQKEKGESLFSLMMASAREEQARRKQALADGKPIRELSTGELLGALFSEDAARELKYLLARQMQDMEAQVSGALGDSVILDERNKACIKVLERELAAGKNNLGIFYGAAHMPDLERSLVKDMGFKRKAHQWITAWTIREKTLE